jgi:hypothetical protein
VYDLIHRHLGVRPRFNGPRSVPTSVCLWLYQWSMSRSTGIEYFRRNTTQFTYLRNIFSCYFLKKKQKKTQKTTTTQSKRDCLLFHKSGTDRDTVVWKQNGIDPQLTFLSLYIQKLYVSHNSPCLCACHYSIEFWGTIWP